MSEWETATHKPAEMCSSCEIVSKDEVMVEGSRLSTVLGTWHVERRRSVWVFDMAPPHMAPPGFSRIPLFPHVAKKFPRRSIFPLQPWIIWGLIVPPLN